MLQINTQIFFVQLNIGCWAQVREAETRKLKQPED